MRPQPVIKPLRFCRDIKVAVTVSYKSVAESDIITFVLTQAISKAKDQRWPKLNLHQNRQFPFLDFKVNAPKLKANRAYSKLN